MRFSFSTFAVCNQCSVLVKISYVGFMPRADVPCESEGRTGMASLLQAAHERFASFAEGLQSDSKLKRANSGGSVVVGSPDTSSTPKRINAAPPHFSTAKLQEVRCCGTPGSIHLYTCLPRLRSVVRPLQPFRARPSSRRLESWVVATSVAST